MIKIHFYGKERGDFNKDIRSQAILRLSEELFESKPIFSCNQSHGTNIKIITKKDIESASNRGLTEFCCDGLFTDTEAMLSIVTGDCLPIVLTSGTFLCVIHAGWKGLREGIIINAISEFAKKGILGRNIEVWIGPSVHWFSYDVTSEFPLISESPQNTRVFGKHIFYDILQFAINQIRSCGVLHLHTSPVDTFTSGTHYSSRKGETGRNLTLVYKV
jgi:polyphenol oxidase